MEFVLNTIFWTLAFYGLYELIKNILYISEYTKFKAKGIYLIIAFYVQACLKFYMEKKSI